jgi:hypothetical protein
VGDMLEAIELVKGRIPRFTGNTKYGVNPDVDTGPESIWQGGGLVIHPVTAGLATFVSTDAADGLFRRTPLRFEGA